MMATICTFHQESFEWVEPSLLWRTDPYHNRWWSHLNKDPRLRNASWWCRDISLLTGVTLEDSGSPTLTNTCNEQVAAFISESQDYFRVYWLLLHIMFTCSGHHYRHSVGTGVWRLHLNELSLPWLDNHCVSLLCGVKTKIWQPTYTHKQVTWQRCKAFLWLGMNDHTHTHTRMFHSLPQERVRFGVWKLHIPSRIRIISQLLLTMYF